jgi:hypothetical protein
LYLQCHWRENRNFTLNPFLLILTTFLKTKLQLTQKLHQTQNLVSHAVKQIKIYITQKVCCGEDIDHSIKSAQLGIKGDQHVRLTALLPSVSRLSSENVGASSRHYGPSQLVTGLVSLLPSPVVGCLLLVNYNWFIVRCCLHLWCALMKD